MGYRQVLLVPRQSQHSEDFIRIAPSNHMIRMLHVALVVRVCLCINWHAACLMFALCKGFGARAQTC
jgi:hypothetical protein